MTFCALLTSVWSRDRPLARAGLGLAGLLAVGAGACSGELALTRLVEARQLAADLRTDFTRAADASNRAIMTDSDEAATTAAGEARQAVEAVASGASALRSHLEALGYGDERRLLESFETCFGEYRTVDGEILGLAVENSNLKAQRLSFGPSREAADAMQKELEAAVKAAPAGAASRVEAQAWRAVAALRAIQVLQAPHIAEAEDAAMTRMEAEMDAAAGDVRKALEQMKAMGLPAARLTAATSAFERFMTVNAEMLTLSRRNSEVRSLALSLGRKRILTAQCDDQLRALQDALAAHAVGGTR
jgi:hypothetical protein